MNDPILIMAMPRSGSSMTAGIFAQHGVWTGRFQTDNRRNIKGSFEGTAIRSLIIDMFGRGRVMSGLPCGCAPGFRERVEAAIWNDGYRGGPWLWKGSVMYRAAWFEYSNPKWVVCRRDEESAIASALAPPYVYGKNCSEDDARLIVQRHTKELDRLVEMGAAEVDTEAVAHGDFRTIKAAIEYCGIAFNERVTKEFVDPSMWHFKR